MRLVCTTTSPFGSVPCVQQNQIVHAFMPKSYDVEFQSIFSHWYAIDQMYTSDVFVMSQ